MFLELPQKVTKLAYLKKIMLLFKTMTIIADQIIDIILVGTLFLKQEYWFAVGYLTVDVFPAAVIMWQKFQTERSWKVLVSFILLQLTQLNRFNKTRHFIALFLLF